MAITTRELFCYVGEASFFNMPNPTTNTPIVIQVLFLEGAAGTERCMLAQNKALLDKGIPSIIICSDNTFISKKAIDMGMPVATCKKTKLGCNYFVAKSTINNVIQKITKEYSGKILAIHVHEQNDVSLIKKSFPDFALVLTQHLTQKQCYLPTTIQQSLDGIIVVGNGMVSELKASNTVDTRMVPTITIPPFFDNQKFTNYHSSQNSKDFFSEKFNISLKPFPILLKNANFYNHTAHKNHTLLLQALQELIYKRKCPVQMVLAGSGARFDFYKTMAKDLRIDDYVYFVGQTDHIPELLEYADINLLASNEEAFGIALLEGGLMKKPTIIATGTGAADWLIIDKQTGFLFQNNDLRSFVDTIQYVLSHKQEAAECGQRLYEKVITEFSPTQAVNRLIAFYKKISLNNKLDRFTYDF